MFILTTKVSGIKTAITLYFLHQFSKFWCLFISTQSEESVQRHNLIEFPEIWSPQAEKGQKPHFCKIVIFWLYPQFFTPKLHQFSILRTVLESSDCVEFKTVPKHEIISKNGRDMDVWKIFLRKFLLSKMVKILKNRQNMPQL